MNKKTLYLHIGIGKTGTTALQHFFWSNRQALARKGIYYPAIGISDGAHHFLSPYHPLPNAGLIQTEKWSSEILAADLPIVLLSSEYMIWAAKQPHSVMQYCRILAARFHVKVIVYLRRQDQLIMATYNQLVKTGLQKWGLNVGEELRNFDYGMLLAPWQAAVGKENILVRPYERNQFYKGDLIRDFLHILGLELTNDFVRTEGNPNPRLSISALEFKRLLNHLMADSSRFIPVLLAYSEVEDRHSPQTSSSTSLLSARVRRDVINRCANSNAMIAKHYLGRQDGSLFYESLPDLQEMGPPSLELSEVKAREIARFILAGNPGLFHQLAAIVQAGLTSGDQAVRNAAAKLRPILIMERGRK